MELVVGAAGRYTASEMAATARVSPDDVNRLWRAMGFARSGADRAFTDTDLAALLVMSGILERELLDLDSLVDVVRAFGQSSSRLSEWQLDTVTRYIAGKENHSAQDTGAALVRLADHLPEFERLLSFVWRRHLAATLGRVLAEFDETPEATDWVTVGFADLVSFTRLSRQLDQASLAMLVQTFETAAADVVYAVGGRLIKTLGDEVMFVAEDAGVAAEISVRLHELSKLDIDLPQMRIGLATGAVLMRMGDVFGTTVNRASRLTASARPGTTLIDNPTAEELNAAADPPFTIRAQTPRPIRGFGLMRPYSLTRRTRKSEPNQETLPDPTIGAEASNSATRKSSSEADSSSGNT